jgi:hypothetical protein
MPNEQDSTLQRAVRAMTVSTQSLDRTIGLLVKLVGGLYVWALLLSMEVFDFIDIDIEPGDSAPEISMEHFLAHGQNVLAMLVLGAGIAAAGRHFWKSLKGSNDVD